MSISLSLDLGKARASCRVLRDPHDVERLHLRFDPPLGRRAVGLGLGGWDWLSLAIVISLLGSLFGFLRQNTFPAKLFMGDTGSMLLGFSLAAVAVRLVESGRAVRFHPVTIVTVLALPILDTPRVMGRRALRRQNPFRPDKTHLHHKLLDLGFSHAAVVPILYGITAAFGAVAWAMRDVAEWVQFVGALALGACVYGTLFLCQRMGIRVPGSLREGTRYPRRPFPVWVRTWLGKSVPLASWLIVIGLCVPALLSGRVSAGAGLVAFGMASFVVVLFPWQSRRKHTAVCYGLSYSSCACLLGILHLLPGAYPWVEGYLAAFTASVLVWALLMMSFRPAYSRILVPTGFETLFSRAGRTGTDLGGRRMKR